MVAAGSDSVSVTDHEFYGSGKWKEFLLRQVEKSSRPVILLSTIAVKTTCRLLYYGDMFILQKQWLSCRIGLLGCSFFIAESERSACLNNFS